MELHASPTFRRRARLGALVLVSTFLCSAVSYADLADLATPPTEVPVRWCALEGSPTAADPAQIKGTLHNRMKNVNDFIYVPQANVALRSGLPAQTGGDGLIAFPLKQYPVIPDLNPVGSPGDVVTPCPSAPNPGSACENTPGDDSAEFNDVINRCREAWILELGLGVTGVTAVQIRRFVTNSGGSTGWVGFGRRGGGLGSRTVLRDDALIGDNLQDKWAAHEFGHTLSLPHGDGIDNDGDGEVDEKDENEADKLNGPFSENLMQYETPPSLESTFGTLLTSYQVDRMRDFIPFITIPPVTVLPGDPDPLLSANTAVDPLGDGEPDIDDFGVENDLPSDETRFFVGFNGLLPVDAFFDVFVFVDADGDPATGGDPSDFLPPATAAAAAVEPGGVDLVVETEVYKVGSSVDLTTTVYRHDDTSGAFVPVPDPGIASALTTEMGYGDDVLDKSAITDIMAVDVAQANAIMTSMPRHIAALGANIGFEVHVIPDNDDATADGTKRVAMTFEPPTFPSCEAKPVIVAPGDRIRLKVMDMPPDEPLTVSLGLDDIAGGMSNARGKAWIGFSIPLDARTGARQVSVEVDDDETAVHASCAIGIVNCDVNGDGEIDGADIRLINRAIPDFRKKNLDEGDPRDVNADNLVNWKDRLMCQRVLRRMKKPKWFKHAE